ncbi:MAG TPA: TIM barrel protein [Pseudolabrys sp.]|nr:TIM barrel protein [Pseudolabrys sp.]
MPRFAANLGYLFTERPLLERVDAAASAGFKAIELQFPYDVPAANMRAAIERNKLTILGLNTPPGEREGEFGLAAVPGRERDWQVLFSRALDYAAAIGASAIHCLAGKVSPDQRPAADRVYVSNLVRAADLAAKKNITLLVEPINSRDRPNYFLNHVEHAADVIGRTARPNVRMQFDFYHVQIVGGDLIYRLEKFLPVIGHLQCAAVPVRHEPDGGEINYPAVFEAVDRLGYRGWIGAEYRPRGRTEDGLGWARDYGVVPKH